MKQVRVLITLFFLGGVVWLVISAKKGDVASIAILASLVTVLLIMIGVGIAILVQYTTARRDRMSFDANMKENLAMMNAVQQVQNQQNAMLLKQAKENQKLLPPGQVFDVDALSIEDDVFNELED
jgi:uncharacterized membrane protein YgaE (UPF0421/DUF939 family)